MIQIYDQLKKVMESVDIPQEGQNILMQPFFNRDSVDGSDDPLDVNTITEICTSIITAVDLIRSNHAQTLSKQQGAILALKITSLILGSGAAVATIFTSVIASRGLEMISPQCGNASISAII